MTGLLTRAEPREENIFRGTVEARRREVEALGVPRTQLAANTATPSGGRESRIHALTSENCVLMQ
jgi:hypothetical protein